MRSLPRLLIGRLMAFIALFAIEMALLRRFLWLILVFPPVTMGIISLNLAVLNALRWLPRSVAGRINGMLCGAMTALFLLVGYYVVTVNPGPTGFIGNAISQFLATLAARRADPSDHAATVLRLGASSAWQIEILLLDLFGLAVIWGGGWITSRRPAAPVRARASVEERPSPLDDRAVTPL